MPKNRKSLSLTIRRKLNFTESQRRCHPNRLSRIGQMPRQRHPTLPVTQPTQCESRGFPDTSVRIIERHDQTASGRLMADLPQSLCSSAPDIRVLVGKQLHVASRYRLRLHRWSIDVTPIHHGAQQQVDEEMEWKISTH